MRITEYQQMNSNKRQELIDLVATTKSNILLLVAVTDTSSITELQLMEDIATQIKHIDSSVHDMVNGIEQEEEAWSDY